MSRELIKSVALELFDRLSYAKTSIEDIARGCKLGKGTIYLHFKSKDEIFMAIAVDRLESRFAVNLEYVRDPAVELEAKIQRYAETLVEDSLYLKKLLFGDFDDISGKVLKEILEKTKTMRIWAQELLTIIATGGREVDAATDQALQVGLRNFQDTIIGAMLMYILDNEWNDHAGLLETIGQRAPILFRAFIPIIK